MRRTALTIALLGSLCTSGLAMAKEKAPVAKGYTMGRDNDGSVYPAFRQRGNYQVKGRVAQVDDLKRTVTIARARLPPLKLSLVPNTRVKLDGQDTALRMIQPGSDIRASFNLDSDQPIALKLEARARKVHKKGTKH